MHIIPVASGKGGVGKSLFSANLAIALGQAGKKVILADFDLGGSNLHLILGERRPGKGIGGFLSEARSQLSEYIQQSQYKNVDFLPGDSEIPGIANLSMPQKRKLIRQVSQLEADYLILDLGAGSSFNTIDFFLLSGAGTIVTTPTPTALVNAYIFLKNTMFRLLHSACGKSSPGAKLLQKIEKDSASLQRIYMLDLLAQIRAVDATSYENYQALVRRFRPRLVMNMLEDPKDADRAYKLKRSCQQYLSLELEHLGVMYRDDLQDTALRSGLPIVSYKPKSVLSQAIYRIADKIAQFELEEDQQGVLADADYAEETFETAEMEAQLDFQAKLDSIDELLNTGALTMGDLIETVRAQQFEIQQLKKENALFKRRLLDMMGGSKD